jgi:protein-S-isoprenylcysteine O-methyltransferase Ste14
VAGFAAMIGYAVLFFGRLPHEEQPMLKSFGDDYCKYMEQTYRLVPGIY